MSMFLMYQDAEDPWREPSKFRMVLDSVRVFACGMYDGHSGHWGTFQGGICQEYVLNKLDTPMLF